MAVDKETTRSVNKENQEEDTSDSKNSNSKTSQLESARAQYSSIDQIASMSNPIFRPFFMALKETFSVTQAILKLQYETSMELLRSRSPEETIFIQEKLIRGQLEILQDSTLNISNLMSSKIFDNRGYLFSQSGSIYEDLEIKSYDADNKEEIYVAPSQFTSKMFVADGPKEEAEAIFDAADELIEWLGYQRAFQSRMLPGSWKRISEFVRRTFGSSGVQERTQAIEDALFAAGNAMADQKVVDMAAKLVSELHTSQTSSACVDLGSFILIKVPVRNRKGESTILFKRLTREDRLVLDEDPTILVNPGNLLKRLKDAKEIRRDRVDELCEHVAHQSRVVIELPKENRRLDPPG